MRIVLPVLAALALGACSGEPEMTPAEAPPSAATAAVNELVRDGDPYAPPSAPPRLAAPQPPPSTL